MERQRLIRLLADEEAKLAALDDPPEKKQRRPWHRSCHSRQCVGRTSTRFLVSA